MIYRRFFKRPLDVLGSGAGLVVLAPLFAVICAAIKLDTRGPAFFTQTRVGKDRKPFHIVKFRTMLTFEDSYYPDGTPIDNYDRITRVGDWLRRTSLDELPQIWNIFRGDMSLIGPRPTLPYQVEKYDEQQARRLEVKPGLTGLAQVRGRNSLTWEEKIRYDLEYVSDLSLLGDLSIILRTFSALRRSDQVAFGQHDEISRHEGDLRKDVGGP